jgi:hypothetical protein
MQRDDDAEGSLLGHDRVVAFATGDSSSARYWRALEASRELAQCQRAAAEAGERRLRSEEVLGDRLRTQNVLSGIGPTTWWLRIRGLLAERRAQSAEEVRRAQGEVASAEAAHRTAVDRLSLVQARADDLPAAREAAVAFLPGADGELARELLVGANELAEALFAAQSARLTASRVDSELSTAAAWSTYDTFLGGGLVASAMKQDAALSAGDAAQPLVEHLATLRKELQDLGAPTAYFGVQMNDLTASFDVWWDNIFSDWSMHNRIGDAQERIAGLKVGLDELMTVLGQRRRDALQRLDALIEGGGPGAS